MVRPLNAAVLGKAVLTLALGALVGAVGTVMHRAGPPWGAIGCLVLVVTAAVTARAWAGWPAWIGYLGGLFLAVQAMAQTGPGGDLLVPSGSAIGWVWVLGSLGLALVTGLLPGRLFDDRPRGHRPGPGAPAAITSFPPAATPFEPSAPPPGPGDIR